MTKTILLLGRKAIILDDAHAQLSTPESNIRILTGTQLSDVQAAFSQAAAENFAIDHVFMGAGIELDKRLEIVREVCTRGQTTCVHMKDATSGPQGFLPFVKAVLVGLRD